MKNQRGARSKVDLKERLEKKSIEGNGKTSSPALINSEEARGHAEEERGREEREEEEERRLRGGSVCRERLSRGGGEVIVPRSVHTAREKNTESNAAYSF